MNKVNSLAHLKELTADNPMEFRLLLNGGVFSRKTITYGGDTFLIWNHIDDSQQELTEAQLVDRNFTNIGDAIERGALLY